MGESAGLSDYTASSLFYFNDEVWVALQGGIARIKSDDEVHIFRDGDGLNASVGSFLAMDDQQQVWTTTHEGIQRIPLKQFEQVANQERERFAPSVFGSLDEPVRAQCNGGHGQAGLFQPYSGMLWCPTLNGILRLDLGKAEQTPPAPRPMIHRARAGGTVYSQDQLKDGKLTLSSDIRDIEIDYAGLYFRFPEGVRYRFKLRGFESDWVDVGDRRTAFYTNLPPGEYEFRVKARNEVGVESEDYAALTVVVSPRFFETSLFRGSMAGLFFLLAYGVWRYSVRHLQRRRLALEKMVRKRTRQLQELNRQLRQASVTDPLTGLRNRRYLSDQLPHDIAQVDRAYTRAGEHPNRDITFLMIDLDYFKRINDEWGHRAGDEVLAQFAQILATQVRESDYVIRWGGEEFLIVARNSERHHSTACAERIMNAVRSHRFTTGQGDLECSCSIGMASYPARTEHPEQLNWEEVIEIADAANYMAKSEGRDRWVEILLAGRARVSDFMAAFREDPKGMARAGEIEIVREKPPAE